MKLSEVISLIQPLIQNTKEYITKINIEKKDNKIEYLSLTVSKKVETKTQPEEASTKTEPEKPELRTTESKSLDIEEVASELASDLIKNKKGEKKK